MKDTSPDDLPSLDALAPSVERVGIRTSFPDAQIARLHMAMRTHPAPVLAWMETGLWLIAVLSLFDHLLNRNGMTATIVWWLTIGPHEIGHLICNPFGPLLMFFGGTFWQIAFWGIIGSAEYMLRRRLRVLLWCGVLVGHSFINAAVYIGDARTRELPLLFGLSSDHHDWYNILNMLGLLPFDDVLAFAARLAGGALLITTAGAGIYFAWVRGAQRAQSSLSTRSRRR